MNVGGAHSDIEALGSLFAMEKANIEIPKILLNRPMLGPPNARNPYDFFITI
jgi:hypothetical protein